MNRCPCCSAFISLRPYINLTSDYVFCRSCGSSIHIPSYSQFANKPVDTGFVSYLDNVSVEHSGAFVGHVKPLLDGFSGNALSNLQPNGKIQKPAKLKTASATSGQLSLFGGVL